MHYQRIPCNTMQYHAIPCNTMQYHAIPCSNMQYPASPWNTMQIHAIPCNTKQCHAIPCNTMQYHAIPCNTMQYHACLLSADGAYHCPVGSIWPFFETWTHGAGTKLNTNLLIRLLHWERGPQQVLVLGCRQPPFPKRENDETEQRHKHVNIRHILWQKFVTFSSKSIASIK